MKATFSLVLVILACAQASQWQDFHFFEEYDRQFNYEVNNARGYRITGGQESVPHSRPYQAGLHLPTARGIGFCGGSLITRQTVLTAAHCVDQLTGPVEVVLGAHHIEQNEATQVRMLSAKIIIHAGWSNETMQNDIALVILPAEVNLNQNIQLVTLPSRGSTQTYVGQTAVVSGWGRFTDTLRDGSPVLREISIPIIENRACNIRYFGSIVDSHICAAGTNGKSTCDGDSGGPLVVDGVQVGVVSFGIVLGCEVGWPHVYARVTSYTDWIAANKV